MFIFLPSFSVIFPSLLLKCLIKIVYKINLNQNHRLNTMTYSFYSKHLISLKTRGKFRIKKKDLIDPLCNILFILEVF